MALTPETLSRHELVGLPVRVVDAANPDLIGIEGHIVRETTNTLHVESALSDRDARSMESDADPVSEDGKQEHRVRQLPKNGTTFEFTITDEAAVDREAAGTGSEPGTDDGDGSDRSDERTGKGSASVTVDGKRLLSRPARRTEKSGESPWQ